MEDNNYFLPTPFQINQRVGKLSSVASHIWLLTSFKKTQTFIATSICTALKKWEKDFQTYWDLSTLPAPPPPPPLKFLVWLCLVLPRKDTVEGTNNERGLDNSLKRETIDYNTVCIDWLVDLCMAGLGELGGKGTVGIYRWKPWSQWITVRLFPKVTEQNHLRLCATVSAEPWRPRGEKLQVA